LYYTRYDQVQVSFLSFLLPVSVAIKTAARTRELSDATLVEGLVYGDHKTIEEVYDRYAACLYGVILRIVRRKDIAEELLQVTFVNVLKAGALSNEVKGRLSTWLINIARNVAFDYMNTDPLDSNQSVEGFHLNQMDSSGNNEHQLILDLVYLQGYSHREAADELGIPVGQLKTQMRAAILALRADSST
jgi:DNA-directed RNA polymerase specialized sigma24 family protein